MFELEEIGAPAANIKVVGVGGAGGNVVNNMIASNIRAVEFIAVNTDAQVLANSMAGRKVQIGGAITRGLGAGSKPEIGRQAALEDKEHLAESLQGADMVFITAGMGGGTGTGAAPVVAEIARSLGALTVAVVTKPFNVEGGRRKKNAELGIDELKKNVDSIIVIPNDRILHTAGKGTPMLKAFAVANDILRQAVQGLSDVILLPGYINVDFADVKTVMDSSGRAVIGMGIGRGEGGVIDAAKQAVSNPLLENTSIENAGGILINITGGLELPLSDVDEAAGLISDSASEDAVIIIGAMINPDLKDEVRVTVIATGFKEEEKAARPTVDLSLRKWSAPAFASLRGSERVLSKSLGSLEDPLDVPTFLRKQTQAITPEAIPLPRQI